MKYRVLEVNKNGISYFRPQIKTFFGWKSFKFAPHWYIASWIEYKDCSLLHKKDAEAHIEAYRNLVEKDKDTTYTIHPYISKHQKAQDKVESDRHRLVDKIIELEAKGQDISHLLPELLELHS